MAIINGYYDGEYLQLIGDWASPSEKYDFVSGDDDISNILKNNPNVPNHQPDHRHMTAITYDNKQHDRILR